MTLFVKPLIWPDSIFYFVSAAEERYSEVVQRAKAAVEAEWGREEPRPRKTSDAGTSVKADSTLTVSKYNKHKQRTKTIKTF